MIHEPVISIRNLSYRYPDGTLALDSVSFEIFRGEKVGLVGANGAGKSTLLLHLNGIFHRDGCVTVGGLKVDNGNLREIRRKVGLVFQNPDDQLFSATVFDDIAFGPRNMGLGEDEVRKRVKEALDSVGLPGFESRPSFHLSLGEKKRVAVATVLAMDPEILALDEPTGSLDPRGRREITSLLRNLGGTQVISTHDLEIVETLCERVIVMREGRIVEIGLPCEVFADRELMAMSGLE
jgi:cobalt/nickel transport system ATP-binding protein